METSASREKAAISHSRRLYPVVLCQRAAFLPQQEALARGFTFPETLQQQLQADEPAGKRQLFTSQPRSRKLKPLVSEFSGYVTLICNVTDTTSLNGLLDTLPKGARICHRRVDQGLCRDVADSKFQSLHFGADWVDFTRCEVIHVGVPKTPENFMVDAVLKRHPRNLLSRVPDAAKNAIEALLHQSVHDVRFKQRANFFAKWLRRSLELKDEDAKLHSSLPAHLQ